VAFDADVFRIATYSLDFNVFLQIGSTPVPVYSNDQIVLQLTTGYHQFYGEQPRHLNASAGSLITVDLTRLTTVGQFFANAALQTWSEMTGIQFVSQSGGSSITFYNNGSRDAHEEDHDIFNGIISYAVINISSDWNSGDGRNLNSYTYQTYLHEIGHALGLGHAGNYNGDATYGIDNSYDNDSWQTSIMSYFDQDQNTFVNASFAYLMTPMAADLLAVQSFYGTSTTTRVSDTVYGFNSNAGNVIYDASKFSNVGYMVFDSGGIDTLNYSGFSQVQLINLNPETFSNVGGLAGNVTIARYTIIENANGGSGNDYLIGNIYANTLFGAAGNDQIIASLGDDVLVGGFGADMLDGGDGADWAYYANSASAVNVYLNYNLGQGSEAAGDTFISIENIWGSNFNDTLIGNDGSNYIVGALGGDVLIGGLGADTLDGGDGGDWAYYAQSISAVGVYLNYNLGVGGDAGGDTFKSIENIWGSNFNDTLIGDAGSNYIVGGQGGDVLIGGPGSDTLDGGDGVDWAYYANSAAAINVYLSYNLGQGSEAAGDTFISIENIWGSNFNDTLVGSAGANYIVGGQGSDVLIGGLGADTLDGGDGADWTYYAMSASFVEVNLSGVSASGGDAAGDSFFGIENIWGTAFADTLIGDANENILLGGAGNDMLTGGLGSDVFYYSANSFGADKIFDYQDAVDHFYIASSIASNIGQLTITGNGTNSVTVTHGSDSIIVMGSSLITLAADDFFFV
jgi:serralysin